MNSFSSAHSNLLCVPCWASTTCSKRQNFILEIYSLFLLEWREALGKNVSGDEKSIQRNWYFQLFQICSFVRQNPPCSKYGLSYPRGSALNLVSFTVFTKNTFVEKELAEIRNRPLFDRGKRFGGRAFLLYSRIELVTEYSSTFAFLAICLKFIRRKRKPSYL